MKKIIYTKKAPDPVGPYSQAIFVNSTLYISGQVAINPETGKIENSNIPFSCCLSNSNKSQAYRNAFKGVS